MIDSGQYIKLAHFFYRMKIIHGNDFVNVSLRNHPKIKNALLEYEKKHIMELEREINSNS